jgi:hypothetical protein
MTMTNRRAHRPNTTGAIVFFAGIALFFIGAVAVISVFGIPGFTGGTSVSQQQSAGAPQPTNSIHSGQVRETTGAGAPIGARPPRQ